MTNAAPVHRLNYMDAVRGFALILGIVFHASLSFSPVYIGWAVMDVSTSGFVLVFMIVSHSFRMALFFLVAGFFSHMTFHSRGGQAFLKSRVVRIAVPFIVGWFILRPLLVSGWIMGAESMQGDANVLSSLLAGFASLGNLPSGVFVGTHLWFLYYLLLVTAGALGLRFVIGLSTPLERGVKRIADATTAWICRSPWALLAVAIPTAACVWFMSHWGMDTPDKSLFPHVPVLLVYGGFFVFGWLLHRSGPLIEAFASLSWGKLLLAILAIGLSVSLAGLQGNPGHTHYALARTGFAFSYAVMMWSLVAITIGLFKRFFDRPSPAVRYIADASYWLYLVHLPIVVWLQIAVAELPFHWSLKLTAVSVITILVALILYDLFVRSTFVGATLNGRRKPRWLSAEPTSPKLRSP